MKQLELVLEEKIVKSSKLIDFRLGILTSLNDFLDMLIAFSLCHSRSGLCNS